MEDIVFISDLHLMPKRPETMELFINFIVDVASKAIPYTSSAIFWKSGGVTMSQQPDTQKSSSL